MGKLESAPLSLYSLTGPKGVVLIFVPYNHQNLLLISPMVIFITRVQCPPGSTLTSSKAGAIAAGNAVCIKTSELLPATSTLLVELSPRYLDQDLYLEVVVMFGSSSCSLAEKSRHRRP